MEPLILIQPLINPWYFTPLVLLVFILRSPWFKSNLGEFAVSMSARIVLYKDFVQALATDNFHKCKSK